MNQMPIAKRAAVLRCLTDGMSIRAASRVTGASKGAILRLLADVGGFCEGYQYFRLRNLPATRIEVDEQWSFVGAKERNRTRGDQGDIWTYAAIDAEAKLVISWLVGERSVRNTEIFMADLAQRLAKRVQLTTDGFTPYLGAIRAAFEFATVDYARLMKSYGLSPEKGPARRYSPPVVTAVSKERMIGRPDMDLASTSYVERLNLNTRQNCRRFTRLTNAFSKKAQNHAYAVALHFFAHNWVRPHGTLSKAAKGKTTPAMASGLTDHVWTWEEVLTLADGAAQTVT